MWITPSVLFTLDAGLTGCWGESAKPLWDSVIWAFAHRAPPGGVMRCGSLSK